MSSVSRGTSRIDALTKLIVEENVRQNLVSNATVGEFAIRHVTDSTQLIPLLPPGKLVDIGSGGGLPGLVIACLREDPIHLVEPRTKRADFLARAATELGLTHVTVHAAKVERVDLPPVAAITARAVASLDGLFAMATHLADAGTFWVLPKGRTVRAELEAARRSWQGMFELVPSTTDPDAAIVVARNVRRRPSA